jgi:hypothetical protein
VGERAAYWRGEGAGARWPGGDTRRVATRSAKANSGRCAFMAPTIALTASVLLGLLGIFALFGGTNSAMPGRPKGNRRA